MPISREQVEHVASLARLQLNDAEIDHLTADLGRILDHVAQLEELNTEGVEPTEHLAVLQLPFRNDEARPGLTPQQALADAPQVLSGGFAVPAFVDD